MSARQFQLQKLRQKRRRRHVAATLQPRRSTQNRHPESGARPSKGPEKRGRGRGALRATCSPGVWGEGAPRRAGRTLATPSPASLPTEASGKEALPILHAGAPEPLGTGPHCSPLSSRQGGAVTATGGPRLQLGSPLNAKRPRLCELKKALLCPEEGHIEAGHVGGGEPPHPQLCFRGHTLAPAECTLTAKRGASGDPLFLYQRKSPILGANGAT